MKDEQVTTEREAAIESLAKSMNAIESRRHAATIDQLATRLGQWQRHLYEAERLLDELADYGMTVSLLVEGGSE